MAGRLLLLLACTLLSCRDGDTSVNTNVTTPNFLVIIADDAGWNDVGYNGSEIQTPNIDFLAKNGVKLDRFYVNPTCSPSRASFLTGRPASRMGIVAPISGRSEKSLPDSILTLPSLLQQQGYETALFGKWHLGLQPASGPKKYGFDYSYGFLHGQIDQYTHNYKNGDSSWYKNGVFITETGHATDLIGKETINWLQQYRDTTKSFYIQLAYSAPHFPLQEEEQWLAPYAQQITNTSRRKFAAAMTHMDDNIGKILATLKNQKLLENTVIIFMSDNGAMQNWYPTNQYEGRHGPNDVLGDNSPLKDWKTSNYEGAIRVPALVYWKDKLEARTVANYISVIDVMPTLLKLAKIEDKPSTLEGRNIWPTLTQKDTLNSIIYVRGHLQESIIEKPWKLVRTRHLNTPTDYELYNIEMDPEESMNILKEHEEVVSRLTSDIENQFTLDDQNVNLAIK